MKTLRIIIKALAAVAACSLVSCGLPVNISANYKHPETGLVIGGGYSSKGGLKIDVSK